MDLLTIGAFASASRLSPKALRLYGDLGLLLPVHVDPVTGYRFYDPAQLERARLVAWLRRLEMPLARIRIVCELDPLDAAREISVFWAEVEAETTARRDLAAFLVAELSHPVQAVTSGGLDIRYAVRSEVGLVRGSNQDAAYADARLLAVADGFGANGAPASRAAIEVLKGLPGDASLPAGELLSTLQDAVSLANHAIGDLRAQPDPGPQAGSTLTALLWTGSQLALVHIGDSRAYLLRGGKMFQITHDHTVVQSMMDAGFLDPEEAQSHPQRAMLLRALDGRQTSLPDLHLQDALPDDRYLLCSDGLSTVVASPELARVLGAGETPQQAVDELMELVRAAGAPDNVSCIVAHVTTSA